MKMNVQPIPTLNERINEIRSLTADIVNKEILPHENELWGWRSNGDAEEGARAQANFIVSMAFNHPGACFRPLSI